MARLHYFLRLDQAVFKHCSFLLERVPQLSAKKFNAAIFTRADTLARILFRGYCLDSQS
jgi:hypothetical protein